MWWSGDELVAQNYLFAKSAGVETDSAFTVDSAALELLGHFASWTCTDSVVEQYKGYDAESVRSAIEALANAGLLIDRAASADEDAYQDAWKHWGTEGGYFHFGCQDAVFAQDEYERHAIVTERTAAGPSPAIFKRYPDAPRIWLPRIHDQLNESFGAVLLRRRTHRQFSKKQVPLSALSTALFYTFAPMRFVDAHEFGTLQLRTSPSGGARHALEGYVLASSVEGLEPGVYHYDAQTHSLSLLSADISRDRLHRIGVGQAMCRDAAFLCAVTAVLERCTYKYQHPRAYRVLLLDAGHLAQTFALVCTTLGLGPFQTGAFRDTELERLLGIDGYHEAAIYVLGAGLPLPSHDGLPAGTEAARIAHLTPDGLC